MGQLNQLRPLAIISAFQPTGPRVLEAAMVRDP
jgi:hypothetical protein